MAGRGTVQQQAVAAALEDARVEEDILDVCLTIDEYGPLSNMDVPEHDVSRRIGKANGHALAAFANDCDGLEPRLVAESQAEEVLVGLVPCQQGCTRATQCNVSQREGIRHQVLAWRKRHHTGAALGLARSVECSLDCRGCLFGVCAVSPCFSAAGRNRNRFVREPDRLYGRLRFEITRLGIGLERHVFLPDSDRMPLVRRAGSYPPAIRTESHRAHRLLVSPEGSRFLARADVPHSDAPIP